MKAQSARVALLFSCLGHAYMHLFTAFYFVIALSLEVDWGLPNHELVKLWALGSFLVAAAALPTEILFLARGTPQRHRSRAFATVAAIAALLLPRSRPAASFAAPAE